MDKSPDTPPPAMSPPPPPAPAESPHAAARPSNWPTAIGVVGLVFGGLGVIGGCISVAMLFFSGKFKELMEGVASNAPPGTGLEVQSAQLEALEQYAGLGAVTSCVAGLLALVLLIGSLGLLRRARWGVTTVLAWAVLKILYSLPAAVFNYKIQVAQFSAMRDASKESTGPAVNPQLYEMLEKFVGVFVGVQVLWLWALPIFLLVWFQRRKIREDVRTW